MAKILSRLMRFSAVELLTVSHLFDWTDDLWGWSLGLLLWGQGIVSDSGKKQAV
jgi:hypothetical protein